MRPFMRKSHDLKWERQKLDQGGVNTDLDAESDSSTKEMNYAWSAGTAEWNCQSSCQDVQMAIRGPRVKICGYMNGEQKPGDMGIQWEIYTQTSRTQFPSLHDTTAPIITLFNTVYLLYGIWDMQVACYAHRGLKCKSEWVDWYIFLLSFPHPWIRKA